MSDLTEEQLIRAAQSLAAKQERNFVLRSDFKRETGIGDHQVLKFFDSWTEFFKAAGLQPQATIEISNDDLMKAAYDVFLKEGGIPTSIRFSRLNPYSRKTYVRRWGTYSGFLAAFRDWVMAFDPKFPFLADLSAAEVPVEAGSESSTPSVSVPTRAWIARGGRRYGSFLNFRGLQHAPINEQGVIFLFGMVAQELGYVVESVATGYPDCEAKRRTSNSKDTWERVQIEFEYESRAFLDHGHDPAMCDVIVCWQHNWPECPIEVLELSSAIQELED